MDAFSNLNWLDLVVFVTLFAGLALGAVAGFKSMFLRLLHYAAAIAISAYLFGEVRTLLAGEAGTSDSMLADAAIGAAVFLAAYLLVLFCVWLAFRIFRELVGKPASEKIDKGIEKSGLKPLDRLLGAAFGTTLGAIPVTVLMLVFYFAPNASRSETLQNSISGPIAMNVIDVTLDAIPADRKQQIADQFASLKQKSLDKLSTKWRAVIEDLSGQLANQMNNQTPATGQPELPQPNADNQTPGQSDAGPSRPFPPFDADDEPGFPAFPLSTP